MPPFPMNTEELYSRHLLTNYGTPAITLTRGEGSRVWDDAGRSYLDFCTGIAVNALGHAHPVWVRRVAEQAAKLSHVSNLYRNEEQAKLAAKITSKVGGGRVLFCNSGAEANEALLKLARLHGRRRNGGVEGRIVKVVVAENAFHGRTFGAMSATPQEKIQGGFRPLLSGFSAGRLNDFESFEALVDDETAAILLEPIQGESGLSIAEAGFLKRLRELCDRRGVMLMFDEIQSGIGRTGEWFGHRHSGVKPDAFSMAKGLGGGFPIGGIWAAPGFDDLFTPGSHGTTFGGGPLACAAALAVFEVLEGEGLVEKIPARSQVWRRELAEAAASRPDLTAGVRGIGYMSGVAFRKPVAPVVAALREQGLLCAPAGGDVIRFLPPLTASESELSESVAILRRTLAGLPS